ncbi:MAG: hypothetical protein EPN85_09055 [Bacteroidetes bacterium]|nr:MAG: hypothetical protein EPN85_09055 [Bacteroidota bacterium]
MAEINAKNAIQLKFFEKLKQSVPQNISLANEIGDVLEISADGAYRRMRGESVLSVDEMIKLCQHYKMSPDFLPSTDHTSATFQFRKMIYDESGFADYIKNILADLQKIHASNPKQIIYAAGDLPLFIQFLSPEYSAFKMFFWQRAVLNLASMEGKKFSTSGIKPETVEMCKRISETYIQIPSTEIWHQDTIASNLNLVEFAWESGMFASKEDALLICKKLSEMLALVEKNAEKSSKFREEGKWAENEGNFTMYQSEFVLMNNHIFVTAGSAKILYLTHNTFNSMATTNQVFCCETEEWLKNLIRKSARMSGEGSKQRHKFFRHSQEKISNLISRISV